MIIKRVCSGIIASNTYLVGDEDGVILIDVGADKEDIFKMVDETGLTPKMVLLTHYHIDHIMNLNEVRDRYGISAAIHRIDASAVADMHRNGARLFRVSKIIKPAEILLDSEQTLKFGSISYRIIHTAGHTAGSICILSENALFTGDTLFRRSIGRTDLGDGDFDKLISSIKEKILPLGDNITIYPGHGDQSTIIEERVKNPFL